MIYIFISVAVLIICALRIILGDSVGITKYSIIPIAIAFCSVVYAAIAFAFKDKANLFIVGKNWFYRILSLTFSANESHCENDEYKKEFELSAFIYCITIPTYITIAFLHADFYSALSRAIGWTIVRLVAIIVGVIIPPILKRIKENKLQRVKAEADRKEQERRESMGKWR